MIFLKIIASYKKKNQWTVMKRWRWRKSSRTFLMNKRSFGSWNWTGYLNFSTVSLMFPQVVCLVLIQQENRDTVSSYGKTISIWSHENTLSPSGLPKNGTHFQEKFFNLYKVIVKPHLEYCSPPWSPYPKKDIKEKNLVQIRARKMIPHLRHLAKLSWKSILWANIGWKCSK